MPVAPSLMAGQGMARIQKGGSGPEPVSLFQTPDSWRPRQIGGLFEAWRTHPTVALLWASHLRLPWVLVHAIQKGANKCALALRLNSFLSLHQHMQPAGNRCLQVETFFPAAAEA